MTTEERFWAKVDKSGDCWVWTASSNCQGYGYFQFGGKVHRAHRVAYEMQNGSIPDGLDVHHTCGNASCVRHSHLKALSRRDHIAASPDHSSHVAVTRDECIRGHSLLDPSNLVSSKPFRQCRECQKIHKADWRARAR